MGFQPGQFLMAVPVYTLTSLLRSLLQAVLCVSKLSVLRAQLQRSLLQEAHLSSAVLAPLTPLSTCAQKSSPGLGWVVMFVTVSPAPRPHPSCQMSLGTWEVHGGVSLRFDDR